MQFDLLPRQRVAIGIGGIAAGDAKRELRALAQQTRKLEGEYGKHVQILSDSLVQNSVETLAGLSSGSVLVEIFGTTERVTRLRAAR